MAALIPAKLSPGDYIGVIAPSDPVPPEFNGRLQEGRAVLESLGFRVKFGESIRANSLGFAATPKEKARDLHTMFSDSEVKAVICAQGGDTANAPLHLLDWELIRSNPKVFLGLSDITVLLNAIHQKTGLVTFHGGDVLWSFGNDLPVYARKEFTRQLIQGEGGEIPPNRARRTIRGGSARGKLLGGNLRCLLKLAGTPYWPDFTEALFFVEAYEMSPKACHAAFAQLLQMGVFDQINGAIVGYIDSMQRKPTPPPHMEDILNDLSRGFNFPILKINDFGHNCPNTILPVGAEAALDADQMSLAIITQFVK
jgi:muramoyltetrapeptide carboxypeptidase